MSLLSIFDREPTYIRRSRVYLQEARMAMLEHSIAAEHYRASADMYAERARRLEEEIAQWEAGKGMPAETHAVPAAAAELGAGRFTGPTRLESSQPAMGAAAPATVGIARVV